MHTVHFLRDVSTRFHFSNYNLGNMRIVDIGRMITNRTIDAF